MGYFDLIKKITTTNDYTYEFYNQIKRTSSNRRTIDNIRQTIKLLNELDGFDVYLYKDGKYYQLDIYSSDCYEGSMRDSNLKQLGKKLRVLYLKLKQKLNL